MRHPFFYKIRDKNLENFPIEPKGIDFAFYEENLSNEVIFKKI